uniref:Cytochrome P450 CYP736A12-like n=1 Tax=Nicotiana tabacum TaxID=4097 RepID=A0A1S3XCB8_TOBAC|nr:PREDICTED: cytochrome P450 CYP736A12-like [Nicotiana tabacum]
MRKLCTVHLLSNHKINSYRSTRSEKVALMIKSIKPSAQDGGVVDLSAKASDKKKTKDFVDTMMSIMQSGEAKFQFDRRHVKAVLLDMLVASIDTSSTSVEWMLSEHLKNPNVMEKVQKELEEVVGLNRMMEESDLDNLKYLNMVFKESFRLHAAAPLLLHEAMEDCIVDDFYIQKGSQAIVNSYSIHMDPNVWTEANKFLPERFLESNVDVRGRDFQLLPFGYGRRNCPRMHLALIIVCLVVAQLVHCFDLDMTEKFGIVTGRAKHLMAIPTYRLHN